MVLHPKLKNQILLGAAALCWEIWLNRNDTVFNKSNSNTFVQEKVASFILLCFSSTLVPACSPGLEVLLDRDYSPVVQQ
jgi:hypothetical protein